MTDGPFGEVKEQLAGLFLVESRASIARSRSAGPISEYGCVENRPVMEDAGDGDVTTDIAVEDLLRELAPQVLGAFVRRYGQFDAARTRSRKRSSRPRSSGPTEGIPDNPRGWLITVASRRLTDQLRGDTARQRRETAAAALLPPEAPGRPAADSDALPRRTTPLTLLFLCCHPSLSPPSQLALTLRAVGGLTTAEIAAAFFVPEATMAQRISRAKRRSRPRARGSTMPPAEERAERLRVVLHVLY